jgi:hypothetical protein
MSEPIVFISHFRVMESAARAGVPLSDRGTEILSSFRLSQCRCSSTFGRVPISRCLSPSALRTKECCSSMRRHPLSMNRTTFRSDGSQTARGISTERRSSVALLASSGLQCRVVGTSALLRPKPVRLC